MTAADYRRDAETKRAAAVALEMLVLADHPRRYIGTFLVIRAVVKKGLVAQYVEARKLRAEADTLDDIACALESP